MAHGLGTLSREFAVALKGSVRLANMQHSEIRVQAAQ